MSKSDVIRSPLNLKAGDWVEVRSREEILATLDQNGRLETSRSCRRCFSIAGKSFEFSSARIRLATISRDGAFAG